VYTLYTLNARKPYRRYMTAYHLSFIDDDGDERIFYDFWHDLVTKVA